MKKIYIGLPLYLIVLFLSGCATRQSGTITAEALTPSQSPISRSPMPTTAPSKTPTPRATSNSQPTSTPTATITSPPISPTADFVDSIEITSEARWGQATGSLLLLDYSSSVNVLMDLSTGAKITIYPTQPLDIYCSSVAPNRLQILCRLSNKPYPRLLILDHMGQVINEYPSKETWHMLAGWLNNNEIMLLADPPPGYNPYDNLPTTLFNLVTGEETILLPDYPDISALEPFNNQGPIALTGTSYSPNAKLVVYESWDGEREATVLWDRENNMEVIRIPKADTAPYPQWNPEGDQVVLVGSQEYRTEKTRVMRPIDAELYILSVSDKAKQMTHLGELFDEITYIYSLGWSPDGQRIAFVLYVKRSGCKGGCIGILNVDTGETEIVNFPNYRIVSQFEPTYSLVWSPDSRQLVLEVKSVDTNQSSIIIFDIERKNAFQIAVESRIEGWLKNP